MAKSTKITIESAGGTTINLRQERDYIYLEIEEEGGYIGYELPYDELYFAVKSLCSLHELEKAADKR